MRRRWNKPKFSLLRFLASGFAAFGVVVLLSAGWYRLWGQAVWGNESPGGLSWSWWIFLGSSGLLASAVLFLQTGSYRRLDMLEKALVLSLLAHLAITSGLSLVYVSRPPVKIEPPRETLSISLNESPEIELGMEIRRAKVDSLLRDPTQDQVRAAEDVAQRAHQTLEAKIAAAPPAMEPWQLQQAAAAAAPKQAEEMAKVAPKFTTQSPAIRSPKNSRRLSEKEKQADVANRDESRQQRQALQETSGDFKQPKLAAAPAKPQPQKVEQALAAQRQQAAALESPAVKPRLAEDKAPQASPQTPAAAAISQAETKAGPAKDVPDQSPLGKAGSGKTAPRQVSVQAQRGQVDAASLAPGREVDRRVAQAGKAAAGNSAPAPGAVEASPAAVAAAAVGQDEAQPGAPADVHLDAKLAKSSPGGKGGTKEVRMSPSPSVAKGQSLAAAAGAAQRVAGTERTAAGGVAAVASAGQVDANPTGGVGESQGISQSEAQPARGAPGPAGRQLAEVQSPVASAGAVRLDAQPANVKQESLTAAANVHMPAGDAVESPQAAPQPGNVPSAAPQAVGEAVTAGAGGAEKASAVEARVAPGGSGDAPGGQRLSAAGATGRGTSQTHGIAVQAGPSQTGGGSLAAQAASPRVGSGLGAAVDGETAARGSGGTGAIPIEGVSAGVGTAEAAAPIVQGEAGVAVAGGQVGGDRLGKTTGGSRAAAGREVQLAAGPSGGTGGGSLAAAAAATSVQPGAVAEKVAPQGGAGTSETVQVATPAADSAAQAAGSAPAAVAEARPGQAAGASAADAMLGPRQVAAGSGFSPSAVRVEAPAARGTEGSLAAVAAKTSQEGAIPGSTGRDVAGPATIDVAGTAEKPLAAVTGGPSRLAAGEEVAPTAPRTADVPQAPLALPGRASKPIGAGAVGDSVASPHPAEVGKSASLAAQVSLAPRHSGTGESAAAGAASARITDVAPAGPDSLSPPQWLAQRKPGTREALVAKMGGSEMTESAVAMALDFLARSQEPEGRWTHFYAGPDPGHRGRHPHDLGLTGLATLCFLASDHTPAKADRYQQVTTKALGWLIAGQAANGDLRTGGANMYGHGMAALALAEAAVMTGDPKYRAAAVKAGKFIIAAQNSRTGGWRYHPGDEGDTSVFGWQVMALFSISHLGVEIPHATRDGAIRWLDSVSTRSPQKMLTGYVDSGASPAMTAEAVFCRILLGQKLTDAQRQEVCDYLLKYPPGVGEADPYQWYYQALTLMQLQGEAWQKWNPVMQEYLLKAQVQEGESAGSWPPNTKHSIMGGRVYNTALATLILEVYYRYLPMYGAAKKQ